MQHLHIISFDIPYPANYGGAIDVFYRIKALKETNVKITLHCFYKDSFEPQPILESLCEKVYFYKRNTTISNQLHKLPYAVYGRKNEDLINNLLKDDFPILFEGLVCCFYLDDKRLQNRIKLFRPCNIEHNYYWELAKATKILKEKIYFALEAHKLKKYEAVITHTDYILALSHNDEAYFCKTYPNNNVIFLPCSHQNDSILSIVGKSDYILYHGNLAVAENEFAATYLCKEVFSKLPDIKCVIAGRNPSHHLIHIIQQYPNIELISNPIQFEMDKLISNAQINLLLTFQNTGLKLKLLNTLFAGRHVIANTDMAAGSNLEDLCHIANDSKSQIALCKQLITNPFTATDIEKRKSVLLPQFSNSEQAKIIKNLITTK
ncbi:MAG: glycosyltransferase family 1 protein [Paludibacteraceae bacterium]|nr:glycosyltransferase family 1 protein [Paludibacteraceae bacterium]